MYLGLKRITTYEQPMFSPDMTRAHSMASGEMQRCPGQAGGPE